MKTTITPEEAEEVRGLWEAYEQATKEAAAAFRADGTDPDFKGERLQRHLEVDGRAGVAISRIKEIYGAK